MFSLFFFLKVLENFDVSKTKVRKTVGFWQRAESMSRIAHETRVCSSMSSQSGIFRLRARFPSGRAVLLTSLNAGSSGADLYGALEVSEGSRVLVAGRPTQVVDVTLQAIGGVVKSGDALIVEPVKEEVKVKGVKGKGRKLRKRGRAKVEADSGAMEDDSLDPDWAEGMETVQVGTKGRTKGKRRKFEGVGQVLGGAGVGEAGEAAVGVALVGAVGDLASDLDVNGKRFRKGLKSAREEREAEAQGERRYDAVLAHKYEISLISRGKLFRVKYLPTGKRAWLNEEVAFPVFERTVLKEVFMHILDSSSGVEDRENLRPFRMAHVSPRIFWNMVRLFPNSIEDGLRSLVPDADWDFLKSRRRSLSEKGKRSAEQKRRK